MAIADAALASAAYNEGRERTGGHVYFVGGDDGPIKIGYTATLHRRLRALKNSSPIAVRLLAAVPGDATLERAYHQRFAADRQHGEWFARTPDLIAAIKEISAG
jgi:hypothetical protein